MDEATFFALLSKYPAVRKGDSAIRPARAAVGGLASLLGGAPPTKDAGGSLAPATVVPLAAAAPPSDFWAGLSDFLVKRFGAAQGKAVAAAFDSLHYSSVRALNYEDVEDIVKMLAKELGVNP